MVRRFGTRMRAVCAVFAATALAACGTAGPGTGAGGGAGEPVVIWALQDEALNKIEQDSINRFGADKAKLETFANDPYKQKLRVALGSPQAPDAFFNWGGGNLKEYVDAGKVADLTGLLDSKPDLKAAFLPSVLDGAKINGKYYGIPMRGMQPVVLFYNKKVFTEAGAEPPKTWDDLLALVDTFKGKGVTPISLAGSQAWTELMWAEYVLDRIAGPEVFQNIRDNGPAGWKDPAVVEAMTALKGLIDRGAFGDNFASVGYDIGGASTLLAQGRAAMHLMGSWEYTNQLSQSPDFVKAGDLGWVPFPEISGGKGDPGNVVGNATNYYSLTEGSAQLDAAKEFVSTQLTSPEYVKALIDAGDVPAVSGIEEQLKAAPNAEYTQWVYGIAKDAPTFQLSWDQDLPADQAEFMLTQLQEFFLGKVSPQQFADSLASR